MEGADVKVEPPLHKHANGEAVGDEHHVCLGWKVHLFALKGIEKRADAVAHISPTFAVRKSVKETAIRVAFVEALVEFVDAAFVAPNVSVAEPRVLSNADDVKRGGGVGARGGGALKSGKWGRGGVVRRRARRA